MGLPLSLEKLVLQSSTKCILASYEGIWWQLKNLGSPWFTLGDLLHYLESSAVTDLQINSMNGTDLIISWEPPASPNGVILSYSLSITDLRDGSRVRQENITDSTITERELGVSLT